MLASLRHIRLGDAPAQVHEAEVARQGSVLERGERDDLRARILEHFEVFGVVEAERVVEGNADAHGLLGARRGVAARRRLHRVRSLHEPLDEVEITVPTHRVTERGDRLIHVRVLEQRQQAGAQVGDTHRRHVRERAEHRHSRKRPDGVLDDATSVVVGDVVENHADHGSRAVQLFDPECRRGGGLAHRPGVDHQDDRRRDDARDLERAPRKLGRARSGSLGHHAVAVEHPHRSLDDHAIRAERSVRKGAPHALGSEQPRVEIPTRSAACVRQVRGVDEVGAHLEGLDGAAAITERSGEAQADRGLPGTRTQAADHEPRNPDLLEHAVPPECAPRTLSPPGTPRAWSLAGEHGVNRPARALDASTGGRPGQVQSCNDRCPATSCAPGGSKHSCRSALATHTQRPARQRGWRRRRRIPLDHRRKRQV